MMFLFLALALIATVAVAVASLILYARWNYGTLERLGIPVVKPHWLLGSLPDLHTKVQQLEDVHRFNELGPVFGLYEGRSPQIHVCDPELVRLIFVKDQDHFLEREPIDLGHSVTKEVLDIQPYPKWKLLRRLWTPLFSVGRVNSMGAQVAQLASEHVQDMKQESSGAPLTVNARTRVTTLLVDILTTCLHGVQLTDRKDPENAVIRTMKAVLREGIRYDQSYNWTLVFPFLKTLWSPFRTTALDSFHSFIQKLVSDRARVQKPVSGSGVNAKCDYTDMLLGIQDSSNTPEYKSLGINEHTMTAQAVELYFGVYDSTGTVLALLLYYLALYPEIQEQLLEEIQLESESNQLEYLTACLNETMRLSPPFLRAERMCTRDWEGPNGLRIPRGTRVMLPLFAAHRDPSSFPSPEQFDPTRFLPENRRTWNQYTFSPFGQGPKNCIGVKFAYEVMKAVACSLLKEFRAEAIDGVTKLVFKPGTLLAAQYEPIVVNLVPRN